MLKVSIIDTSPIFVHGLTSVLTSAGFQVVGGSPVAEPSWLADVVLVSPDAMPDEELRRLIALAWQAPVLLVGSVAELGSTADYLDAGAAGYVHRCAEAGMFLTAIRTVVSGGRFWPGRIEAKTAPCPASRASSLSPREQQVLAHIARGLTHHQVARRLGISPHTVDTYVRRARIKLHLGNKADLTRAVLPAELTRAER